MEEERWQEEEWEGERRGCSSRDNRRRYRERRTNRLHSALASDREADDRESLNTPPLNALLPCISQMKHQKERKDRTLLPLAAACLLLPSLWKCGRKMRRGRESSCGR